MKPLLPEDGETNPEGVKEHTFSFCHPVGVRVALPFDAGVKTPACGLSPRRGFILSFFFFIVNYEL